MMQSLMGMPMVGNAHQVHSTGPIFDEYSRQMSMPDPLRLSHHRPTNAMRIVKPSSANNSPQAMMMRRRTLMGDNNLARRRQQALDQAIYQQMQAAVSTYGQYQESMKRSSRPVSWHPSSRIQQQQQQQQQYYSAQQHDQQLPQFDYTPEITPTHKPYAEAEIYSAYQQFSSTPAAYSGHGSPLSTVSPMSLPFVVSQPRQTIPQFVASDAWCAPAQFTTAPYSASASPGTEPFPSYTGQSGFNWDNFATHGYDLCTAPPTPDNYQVVSQPEPVVPAEESIPYQPLEGPEEDGEILVGMGLYDAPDKSETDPELDNYRTTTSHLLGSTYRRGAGLKLEEAWEPPKDDEKDDDGEAEDDE